jgi:16S rRNA (uracil1498-N3)-methyltransferase
MKIHRFYCEEKIPLNSPVLTDERIVFQIHTVLRLTLGECIDLFSADGESARYKIVQTTKSQVQLEYVEKLERSKTPLELRVCLALLKKDNFELAVAKLTEMGVSEIVPLLTARTEKKNIDQARLGRIVIESSEQSGRTTLPKIQPIATLEDILTHTQSKTIYFGSLTQGERNHQFEAESTTLCVGPEGGWTAEEEALLRGHGARALSFGTTTLRAETAALALSAIILNQ